MEAQIIIVNGRPRRSHRKFGKDYIRCYYDIEVELCEHFRRKCDYLGHTDSAMVRELIKQFNISFGWNEAVKDPGSLFDRRVQEQVKDAVKRTVKKEFPWIFSGN